MGSQLCQLGESEKGKHTIDNEATLTVCIIIKISCIALNLFDSGLLAEPCADLQVDKSYS